MPPDAPSVTASGGYYYPNSAGLAYEAAAIARCLSEGKREVPQWTRGLSEATIKVLEEYREAIGMKTPAGMD